MMPIPTVLDRHLKAVVPDRKAWLEAWGFLLIGAGLLTGMACYSFNPYDYVHNALNPRGVTNLAGTLGADVAAQVLGRFGVVGLLWPVVVLSWGIMTVLGFATLPRPRRLLGFLALTADLAGFSQLLMANAHLPEPSFGYGGLIGKMVKHSWLPALGYGGTLIVLAIFFAMAMVLTGNLVFSHTAMDVRDARARTRRLLHKWVGLIERRLADDDVVADGDAGLAIKSSKAAKGATKRAELSATVTAEAAPLPLKLQYQGGAHGLPSADLFATTKAATDQSAHFLDLAQILVEQLAEFKIAGEIKTVTQGPVVTTFEFKPAPGTKVSKIAALGEDLARLLKAQSLRVLAPIPGKDTVGFEVPNDERAVIGFANLVGVAGFRSAKRKLPIAMGVDIFGQPIIEDLADMPHLLVAGSTGSGKSVFMNSLIGSLIARHNAASLRLVMIDPKMVELAAYNVLPHLACPVITDPRTEAKAALDQLVAEMENRYRRMRSVGARNIDSFNDIVRRQKRADFSDYQGPWAAMPYIVLIIDEMADMMMQLGKDAEAPITRLAQKARACGIHLVIATQRPTADVVTGLIKANFPTRVAFRVLSGLDSRTIIDQSGAEALLGRGDMLYMAAGGVQRLHGAYISDSEVQAMVAATKLKTSAGKAAASKG